MGIVFVRTPKANGMITRCGVAQWIEQRELVIDHLLARMSGVQFPPSVLLPSFPSHTITYSEARVSSLHSPASLISSLAPIASPKQ